VSDGITVRERGATDGCPFCRDTLLDDDEVLRCGTCETRLHAACFRENGLACTVLGCGGRAVVSATDEPSPAPDEVPWESKRARKRRLRAQQRAERRAARRQPERPRPTYTLPAPAADLPWFQGPIGLALILTLLLIVPPLVLQLAEGLGEVPAGVLAMLAFLGGLALIVYIGARGEQR
jgi:hypothetical protein